MAAIITVPGGVACFSPGWRNGSTLSPPMFTRLSDPQFCLVFVFRLHLMDRENILRLCVQRPYLYCFQGCSPPPSRCVSSTKRHCCHAVYLLHLHLHPVFHPPTGLCDLYPCWEVVCGDAWVEVGPWCAPAVAQTRPAPRASLTRAKRGS